MLDEAAHTLTYTGPAPEPVPLPVGGEGATAPCQDIDPAALRVKVFDSVTVALFVRHGAHHRRDLVVKVVDPPFHALAPMLPPPGSNRQVYGSEAARVLSSAGVPPGAVQVAPEVAEGMGVSGKAAILAAAPAPAAPTRKGRKRGRSKRA